MLSVEKLHEMSLVKSLPHPWASTLVAMVPSNIRTEPTGEYRYRQGEPSRAMDSVVGRVRESQVYM